MTKPLPHRPGAGNKPIHGHIDDVKRRYGWRNHGRQWMELLGRHHVLIPNWSYGTGSMRGSVILVTNAPQRTPQGYMRISTFTDRQETRDARRPLRRAG